MQLLILLICLTYGVHPAKILGVFPTPAGSHYIQGNTLMNALLEKGHDVTFIAAFQNKNPPKNGTYREILLPKTLEKQAELRKHMNFYGETYSNPVSPMIKLYDFILQTTEDTLSNSEVRRLLKSNETFDVVIIEEFLNQALKGLAFHFNAPLIVHNLVAFCNWVDPVVANPSPLSYIPEYILSYSSEMTFFQRLINSLTNLLFKIVDVFYLFPKQEEILKKYFPNAPDFYDLFYNASLVLLNSHPSVNLPIPLVPNIIEIGGFHIKPPKQLPKDLQEFLDSAKDGVIYFSMGSNLKSAELPLETRDAFLKAFSKLKEKVLWKWEDEELPGKPDNVKIGKWLPQQDILAHPNVKLFITQGGILSSIETIYYGLPILSVPIIGDQMLNAARAANYGYALVLPFSEVTEEKLSEKISEILNNPKYREIAKFRSKLFRDQQIKPIDKAVYWVEYIARHGRVDHLKVAGLKLPWYKYHLLDVIAFAFLTILIINIILFLIIKKMCFGKNTKLKGLERNKKLKKN